MFADGVHLVMCVWRLVLCWALLRSGNVGALVFVVGELLAVVLACINRSVRVVDARGWVAVVVPAKYVVGAFLVVSPGGGAWEWLGIVAGVGVVWLRLLLGFSYSFGVPTWFRLVDYGPYRWVRHPQVSLHVITRVCLTMAWCSVPNLLTLGVYLALTAVEVFAEERFLGGVEAWGDYARRVRWRLIPGVF